MFLTGIIYKLNIPMYWSTDSLYYAPMFQTLWQVIDFIYFRSFYTSMVLQISAMIPIMVKKTTVIKFDLLLKWDVVLNFNILESSCVLAYHLYF